jgi:hypothetical protein
MAVHKIDRAKNQVVMDMPLVPVRCQNVFIFAFQNLVGKPPSYLMRLFRRGFPRFKALHQVMGEVVTFP